MKLFLLAIVLLPVTLIRVIYALIIKVNMWANITIEDHKNRMNKY